MTKSIFISSISDAYINSACPDANFADCIINKMGRKNSYSINRLLIKFCLPSIPKNISLVSGKLRLYVTCVQNSSIKEYFTPYLIEANWREHYVTWNNSPDYDENIFGSSVSIDSIGWHEWDVTDIVKKWYDGQWENYGLIIKAAEDIVGTCESVVGRRYTKGIYSDLRPILKVDYCPTCSATTNANLVGRCFQEETVHVDSTNHLAYTQGFDVSQKTLVTFYVKNTGTCPANVKLQISPNNIDYIDDSLVYEIKPGEIKFLVPRIYSKYVRIAYESPNLCPSTTLNITLQTQV